MTAQARFFCKTGVFSEESYTIDGEATIGKNPGNTIRLASDLISGMHARIFSDPGGDGFMIEDLGSRNGTRVDGIRLKKAEKLGDLHVITFADTFDFVFQVVSSPVNLPEELPPPGEVQPKDAASPSAGTVYDISPFDNAPLIPSSILKQEDGAPIRENKTMIEESFILLPGTPGEAKQPERRSPDVPEKNAQTAVSPIEVYELEVLDQAGQVFPLHEGENTIGRENSSGIVIPNNSVSRNHAVIRLQSGKIFLSDLESKNHTYVNDKRISQETEIASGAMLRFGVVEAKLMKKL